MTDKGDTTSAVILAAGVSKRLGFNKLTLKVDGQPVIRRSIMPFLAVGITKVVVIVNGKDTRIQQALEGLSLSFVENPCHEKGMSSSLKAALPLVEDGIDVFFHLGDKPFVSPDLINLMVYRFRRGKGNIVVPVHGGKKGHPVLVDVRAYSKELWRLHGDSGLRDIIEKHEKDVVCIEGGEECLLDIDTRAHIDELRMRGHTVEEG
jgi:molybdenum cofactor cytidylyltransferase